jgi:putative transposase
MKKSRLSAEQIVSILNEAAKRDTTLAEICREHGITEQTYYRWRCACGGMQVSEAKRLRVLEDENRRLKRLVADQALDTAMLKDVAGRTWSRPNSGGTSSPTCEPPTGPAPGARCALLGCRDRWHYQPQRPLRDAPLRIDLVTAAAVLAARPRRLGGTRAKVEAVRRRTAWYDAARQPLVVRQPTLAAVHEPPNRPTTFSLNKDTRRQRMKSNGVDDSVLGCVRRLPKSSARSMALKPKRRQVSAIQKPYSRVPAICCPDDATGAHSSCLLVCRSPVADR